MKATPAFTDPRRQVDSFVKMGYDNRVALLECSCGMSLLPDKSADIIIADPPYNIGKDFGVGSDSLSPEGYLSFCRSWVSQGLRVLKDSGTMYVYGMPEGISLIASLVPDCFRSRWLIWHYTNRTVPGSRFWQRSFEAILAITGENPVFNIDAAREPYTKNYLKCAGKPRKPGRARFGSRETVYAAHERGALPRDVLKIPALAGGAGARDRIRFCRGCGEAFRGKGHHGHDVFSHPTQKPDALTRRLLLAAKPGGPFSAIVPFAGSGSECSVIKKAGGSFAAFELNPEYALMAQKVIDENI